MGAFTRITPNDTVPNPTKNSHEMYCMNVVSIDERSRKNGEELRKANRYLRRP
jgi:hypothetical protein